MTKLELLYKQHDTYNWAYLGPMAILFGAFLAPLSILVSLLVIGAGVVWLGVVCWYVEVHLPRQYLETTK